jgi:hypothetical protein
MLLDELNCGSYLPRYWNDSAIYRTPRTWKIGRPSLALNVDLIKSAGVIWNILYLSMALQPLWTLVDFLVS